LKHRSAIIRMRDFIGLKQEEGLATRQFICCWQTLPIV
jgi:hypothetical protein